MAWTATFTREKPDSSVGTLTATYNAGQVDEFVLPVSIDLGGQKDLVPLGDKLKILQLEHEAARVKADPYAQLIADLVASLNK